MLFLIEQQNAAGGVLGKQLEPVVVDIASDWPLAAELASHGARVIGITDGYEGMINGEFSPLGPRDVGGIMQRGGTILMTATSEAFLTSQNEAMKKEIAAGVDAAKLTERLQKNIDINDIIDAGNSIRLTAWRAQAERHVKALAEADKYFDTVEKKLADVRSITKQDVNLKQLDEIKAAASAYRAGMNELGAIIEHGDIFCDLFKNALSVLCFQIHVF